MTLLRRRLPSIDAFRSITMLLMIFVNDLILDARVPAWLEHAEEGQDRLGLADTVFPAFLFIVGLSIPLAIKHGQEKGISRKDTFWHILRRGVALLVMGVFIVNYEEYTTGPALLSKWSWMLITTIAFFFVWLVYPADWPKGRKILFRGLGITALVVLALVYKGGTAEHPAWMKTHWYGILGLIGWVYLVCALLYFYIGERLPVLAVTFLFFLGVSIAWNSGWLKTVLRPKPFFWFEDSGGLCAFAMAGIMVTIYYRRAAGGAKVLQNLLRLAVWVPLLLAAGFALRPVGGIAKLSVSPAWILICTAIPIACFILLAVVVDIRGRENWYRLIRPAGTITLTCYLLPYIHFAIIKMLGEQYRLPPALRTGGIGVLKSLVFAFLIVLLAGVLERKKIRLSV